MKVLIIRFSSIGDIVLTTPVIRCLKMQVPGVQVHYATKQQYAGLLRSNPYIDKIHALGNDKKAFYAELKSEGFDLIIDLHHNLRTLLLWLKLRRKRVAFDKLNIEKWFMTFLKIDILPMVHIVDRYMETLASLGVENDGKGLDFFIDRNENLGAFTLPESYCVYAIGGQHATKQLPLDKQVELLYRIHTDVVLIGGKEDIESGENICKLAPNAINLCGRLTINQSALLMEKAKRVFTHDTGMMHIAAALNKMIVSIWGNTIPQFGMYPYFPSDEEHLSYLGKVRGVEGKYQSANSIILEVEGLSCRPCSKIGYDRCPKGHFKCMRTIDFSTVEF